jgi:D-alanine-D-alanine ligase
MKIAVMHNLNRRESLEELEFDLPSTIDGLVRALAVRHDVRAIECHRDLPGWLGELLSFAPDFVFSVAEGYPSAAREAFYPALYEQLGLPYSGSDATTMLVAQNKALTKSIARAAGILTPSWAVAATEADLPSVAEKLSFPVLVKPNSEGSSMGIDNGAVVSDYPALVNRVRYVWERFNNLALVEEFIPGGYDLSVSYVEGLGPEVFDPVAYAYIGPQMYDYDWKSRSYLFPDIVVAPTDLPVPTARLVQEHCRSLAKALDLRGYGRADFRVGQDGQCYFLEMNAQVEMAEKSEFPVPVLMVGYSYQDLILHIAEFAARTSPRLPSVAGIVNPA